MEIRKVFMKIRKKSLRKRRIKELEQKIKYSIENNTIEYVIANQYKIIMNNQNEIIENEFTQPYYITKGQQSQMNNNFNKYGFNITQQNNNYIHICNNCGNKTSNMFCENCGNKLY